MGPMKTPPIVSLAFAPKTTSFVQIDAVSRTEVVAMGLTTVAMVLMSSIVLHQLDLDNLAKEQL